MQADLILAQELPHGHARVQVQDVPDPLEDASQVRGERDGADPEFPVGADVSGELGVDLGDLLVLASDLVLLELVLESLERQVRGIALILSDDYLQLKRLQGCAP